VNPIANAALTSWVLDPRLIILLISVAFVYLRGWLRIRRVIRDPNDSRRLAAFLVGLAALFVATESPLDTLDSLFLSAHMTQHLLLMMIAPPLILLGHPTVPLLRGLPKPFVREGLGPFLTWPALKHLLHWLLKPPVAWSAFAFSTVLWHVPKFYELALHSPSWHGIQHASFFWTGILFWWPVVQPGPGKPTWPRWTMIPYLLFGNLVNAALSFFFVFSGSILYPTYEAVRASSLSARDDQAIAGLIMWVPGSLPYLVPVFVIAMRLFSHPHAEWYSRPRRTRPPDIKTFQVAAKLPRLRPMMQVVMLLIAIAVMADGWWGPQVAPLNLAGTLPWIHWRALSVLALLVIGNLFCMSCPFTLVRDFGRKVLPASYRWPRRLRNKWLATALVVIFLWAYEAFALWDSPFWTAWIIAGYFTAAVAIDGIFRGASFCKYVCPIGQFHFVSSLISPREVAVKNVKTCTSCRTYDCIRGNERTRGCELYLFQPKKVGNLDCTFCLDCVKACPHDNVGILPVIPARTITIDSHRSSVGSLSKRADWAALVLIFVFGAFVNAAGMTAPAMMWEHDWHRRLGIDSMPLIVGAFVAAGVVIIPALAIAICGALNSRMKIAGRWTGLARRLIFTLVPVGFAMWAAHFLFHFATSWSRPLPDWLTPMQILLLDCGLLLTLFTAWRVAGQATVRLRRAIGIFSPWAVMAVALYGAGVWILFQPMQMRGMMP
jgi:cytochrome c oxidase assembly factor CtaG/ferredoxin